VTPLSAPHGRLRMIPGVRTYVTVDLPAELSSAIRDFAVG